jgi:hypothetical protein
LVGAVLATALGQQIRLMDQAGAAMATQGLRPNQGPIGPGERFLQHPAITRPAELGGAP